MLDMDRAAKMIRIGITARGLNQTRLAKKAGLHRNILNLFLCRHINLLNEDVLKLFRELGIEEHFKKMS